jgi:hypothetical protein
MAMQIEDLKAKYTVDSAGELEMVLQKKYRPGVNEFCFSHDNEKFSTISLLGSGDLATLNFFPYEGHPGFVPVGDMRDGQDREHKVQS